MVIVYLYLIVYYGFYGSLLVLFLTSYYFSSLKLQELKANPNRNAKGTVIEAGLDKSRGPVATFIVQNGTLKRGDIVVCGEAFGKVCLLY